MKINGTDFNLPAIGSLEEFKKDGEHSFCKGKTDKQIEDLYNELIAIKNVKVSPAVAPLKIELKDEGNNAGHAKKESTGNPGK